MKPDQKDQIAIHLDDEAGKLCRAWDDKSRLSRAYKKPDVARQAHNVLEELHHIDRPPGPQLLALFARLLQLGDGPFLDLWQGTPSRAQEDDVNLPEHHRQPETGRRMPAWDRAVQFEAGHDPDPVGKFPSIAKRVDVARKAMRPSTDTSKPENQITTWRRTGEYREAVEQTRRDAPDWLDLAKRILDPETKAEAFKSEANSKRLLFFVDTIKQAINEDEVKASAALHEFAHEKIAAHVGRQSPMREESRKIPSLLEHGAPPRIFLSMVTSAAIEAGLPVGERLRITRQVREFVRQKVR